MKATSLLVTIMTLVAPLSCAQQPTASPDEIEIHKVIDNFEEAYGKRDGVLWVKYFAEDADFMQAFGRYLEGRSQIQEFMTRFILGQTEAVGKEIERRVQLVKPDVAFAEMTEEIAGIREADGTLQPPRKGHMLLVMKKEGRDWKIVHYRYLDIHTGSL